MSWYVGYMSGKKTINLIGPYPSEDTAQDIIDTSKDLEGTREVETKEFLTSNLDRATQIYKIIKRREMGLAVTSRNIRHPKGGHR